ncbi:iron ABC transporter permease [Vibrio sp. 10N.286.49.B3]|uniref:FecCD family ABC transporter permease n=1 Tax=Vibrio sp. 10N.286.49.B3 TaxID=1880855 RepID=UPI000C85DE00|nr:iron ABC transporter permease [Vibrio sp. 10N.286.49.B3]PMH37099.1 iron ABC transporter permease [Vibrio sp. 10N.286.49.B3]
MTTYSRSGQLSNKYLALIGFACLYAATVASISMGPMDIDLTQSINALLPKSLQQVAIPDHIALVIQQIRLPRTLLAITVGAILALCGTVMQGLFRNSLADPGIIGVSSGASLGAAIAIVLFGSLSQSYPQLLLLGTVPVFSFLGGALTTIIVYKLGTSAQGTSVTMMLLAGVAIGALAGAGLGLMNYYADDQALRDLSLWTMGSLAGATWQGIMLSLVTLIVLGGLFYRDADRLNALLLGESEAKHMGIRVQSLKRRLILLTAAGVGVTVSLAGMIGFVGLIVPHIGRMLIGPNHQRLIPLSMLIGALLLLIADMIARTIVAPLDMPVGIITALIGAPFFMWLLIKQKGQL